MEHCLIIGSGAAGLTAGIYAARANLEPLIVGGLLPGGQLMLTSDVENFPGHEQPIAGMDLMEITRKQCARLGARFVNDQVERCDFGSFPRRLRLSDGKEIQAKSVIVATGANAKWLGMPSETRLRGKGVSACAVCDGFFFKGKELVVVGGGDTAIEEATFLTNFASRVSVVHRRDRLRAGPAMESKAKANLKINFIWDSAVEEVLGEDAVSGVRLKNLKTGASRDFSCQGLFIAIGHEPSTKVFASQLPMDEQGYIRVEPNSWVKTSVPGVFAAGDCVDRHYRQAVTAAAFGCMAAMEAHRWLEERGADVVKPNPRPP
ncbi:MAG: thioredoxin-disulfide reductase [Elusimicrobiota bacterium]